jgi:HSP20 family protein
MTGRQDGGNHRKKEMFMNLMRWEPFRETDDFFRSMTRPMFGRWPHLFGEDLGTKFEWSPAVDIKETDKEYLVRAELPGLSREDVKVTLEDSVLTIEGERRQEKEEKGEKVHRVERFYGSFCRSFTLPEDANANGIRAESKDGILNVHVPKLAIEKAKAVQIKVN